MPRSAWRPMPTARTRCCSIASDGDFRPAIQPERKPTPADEMMRNVVVKDAEAAVEGIKDGHTVMVGGFGGAGLPTGVIKAVLDKGVRDLVVISNNAGSSDDDLALWFGAKIVRKIVCSYPRNAQQFAEQYRTGAVELELVPQGTLVERIRAGGAGLGGFLSPV